MTDKFFERRSEYEIINDILESSLKGANKTRILHVVGISYKLFEKYYSKIQTLIEEKDGIYTTTDKGKKYVKKFKPIKDMLVLP